MKFDTGTIVIGVAVLLFYARLLYLRQKHKRIERQQSLDYMRAKAKRKKNVVPPPQRNPQAPFFQVISWWLVVPAFLLCLIGIYALTSGAFIEFLKPYWYIPAALGLGMLAFSIK